MFDSPTTETSLPDISLRPDSAASHHRVRSAPPARSLSTSSQPTTALSSTLKLPLTPSQAAEKYKRYLTAFELDEIQQYPQIYFVGPQAKKVVGGEDKGPNSGYDDDKGRYKLVKNDHIGYRFEVVKGLGKGSFGDVVRTYDHKTQQYFALKIIRNERRFHKQGQIEIKILEHLRKEDRQDSHNIIHISEWFVFRNHICITFELLHCDLYSALKADGFRGFAAAQVKSFALSLLNCLRVLRRTHIIHCDLKPENILLCRKDSDDIKVIDFGSACYDTQKVHTYIQSRFYRSPEVILGASYGLAIDMWSVGCILVELLTGQPLFPGHDEKEQLLYQMEMLGVPSTDLLTRCKRASVFFDSNGEPRQLTDNKGRRRVPGTRPLARVLGRADPELEDFVLACLCWDPEQRLTPRDALKHPYVATAIVGAKMRRSISESARPHTADADADEVTTGLQHITVAPAPAAATYVLPPVQMSRGAERSVPAPTSVVSAAAIPAALMPRRPSTSKMTSDQLAHAERLRAATTRDLAATAGALQRRASISREKPGP